MKPEEMRLQRAEPNLDALNALKEKCGDTALNVTNQMMDLVEAAFFAGVEAGLANLELQREKRVRAHNAIESVR